MLLQRIMKSSRMALFAAFSLLTLNALEAAKPGKKNPPWFHSIDAFEHHDSGRSHLFAQAKFGGSFKKRNHIITKEAPASYPSVYNMTYLNPKQIFAYGGSYGNNPGSIGAFVAKINPKTLQPTWYNQLINTSDNGEWDYPGVMGILQNGHLYVIYGYRLSKLDPATGDVIATVELPTGEAEPQNTAYNGFDATTDGILVMKSIYRQAGCTLQGPEAVSGCPDPTDVPASVLVSVNPTTMEVIDQVTLPATIFGRLTVGSHEGRSYVYLFSTNTFIRYLVNNGILTFDASWNPGTITLAGQNPGSALVAFDDWVVGQCNGSPSATALSVVAVNQGNASLQFAIQPFLGDPIPPLVAEAFSTAANGEPAISWMPSSVSVDPEEHIVYAMDAVPGKIAAIKLGSKGLRILWKADQTTTEFIAIIGRKQKRVIVGTDIPRYQIPGDNTNDFVVWRNAKNGKELARSPLLPAITSGSMVQPSYFGNMFYPGKLGNFYHLRPVAKK